MNIYTLDVFLINGPITDKFLKKNPVISRTLEITGNQTLRDLHNAIFDAFDRFDDHMYEFQLKGEGPNDPKAKRYTLSISSEEEQDIAGHVANTTLDSLELKQDEAFGYWFDYGDDWWHQINVLAIEQKNGKGKYPKVIKRIGKSPPQYADMD